MVREDEVRGQERAHRRRVRVDIAFALGRREVLQEPGLQPLVAVEHEHGQQPVGQIRHDDRRRTEVVALRVALLADDRDVVAGAAPLGRERARVDVRAGAAEEVAVPEDDAHVRAA